MARLLLLDTASLYYRAFFGLPDSLRSPDGEPVNAVRGLLDFIAQFVAGYHPTSLACCWDNSWRPSWRVSRIPSYKAHRQTADGAEETPELLAAQIDLIRTALSTAGLAVVGADDFEADDVIGTLARRSRSAVDIATGDRDLFQLVDDSKPVRVLYCAKGVSRHEVVDDSWLQQRYRVPASRYVDFAVLRGDPSDGLPGVAGVGEVTAAKLVASYPGLDAILHAADQGELAPGLSRKLLAAGDYLATAAEVVAVAEAPLAEVDLSLPTELPAAFGPFAQRWGLTSSADRLAAALAQAAGRNT